MNKRAVLLPLALILLFTVLFFITRVPGLGTDAINPDGVNWHYRSQQFIVALKEGEFLRTYQTYHPGVTLMWIAGIPIELYKQIVPSEQFYGTGNFLTFNFIAKFSVVLAQYLLTLLAFFLLYKVLFDKFRYGFYLALEVVTLFSLEPFFAGNSRLFHMDILLTLFLFNGLILGYWTAKEFSYKKAFFTGALLAAAFLTKSVGIGGIIFVLLVGGFITAKRQGLKCTGKYIGSILISFLVVMFAMFPALWVKPGPVLYDILYDADRIGIRGGHGQLFLGQATEDPGVWFYPLVLLMKVSPVVWLGIISYIYFTIKNLKNKSEQLYVTHFLLLFFLGYLFVMIYPTKKIDRYMLPMYPLMSLLAIQGFLYLGKAKYALYTGLASVFIALPLIFLYPYYFTYTSPVFGSAQNANNIIGQKTFGIAIPELRNFIVEKYGDGAKLGFYDIKPMSAIYSNSKVFDLEINGTSDYDLMVLGINEEIPEKVIEESEKNGYTFEQDSSFYVNDLEFWRIYVKKSI